MWLRQKWLLVVSSVLLCPSALTTNKFRCQVPEFKSSLCKYDRSSYGKKTKPDLGLAHSVSEYTNEAIALVELEVHEPEDKEIDGDTE